MTTSVLHEVQSARDIRSLRNSLQLTQHEFAHVLKTSSVSVARWESDRSKPSGEMCDRIERLRRIIELVTGVIKKAAIANWLVTPHPGLRNYPPADLLSNEYGFEEVNDLIESIKWGAFS